MPELSLRQAAAQATDDPYGYDADAVRRLMEPYVAALHETLGSQLDARVNALLEDRELNAGLRACLTVLPSPEIVRRMHAVVVNQIVCIFLAGLTTRWIISAEQQDSHNTAADQRDMFNAYLDDMLELKQERRAPQPTAAMTVSASRKCSGREGLLPGYKLTSADLILAETVPRPTP